MSALERRPLGSGYDLGSGQELYYSLVHSSWAVRKWDMRGHEHRSWNVSEQQAQHMLDRLNSNTKEV